MDAASLEERFQALADEWRHVQPPAADWLAARARPSATSTGPRPVPDEAAFLAARAEVDAMRATGRWVSGPGDLLSILGRQRDELFHSRLIGWLLRPNGRHGLGDRFARALFAEIWPGEEIDTAGGIAVELERTRSGLSDATGKTVEARADLVVTLESLVIVIENKLDAGEGRDQCERLYWPWSRDAVETRWVFLTPGGREQASTTSPQARAAWVSAGYAQVMRALEAALALAPDIGDAPGRASARQYLATLRAQVH